MIEHILRENNYNREEVIFLGDSINDYESTLGAGVEFVATVFDNLEIDVFPNINLKIKIKTIDEFKLYLDRENGLAKNL